MRGAFVVPLLVLGIGRITPAHAGSIIPLCIPGQILGDHPRACGEHYVGLI